MKFKVSPRLKLPCMPWPWRSTVSAICTEQLVGSSHPDDQERKLTTIDGCGVDRLALEAELRHRQRAGEIPELVVDEDAADVILFQQRLDGAVRELAVLAGNIDQVRSAIGGDHQIGLGGILAEHAVAGLGMGVVGDAARSCRWGRTAAGSAPSPDRSRGSPSGRKSFGVSS